MVITDSCYHGEERNRCSREAKAAGFIQMSVPEMVDRATSYVKELQTRMERYEGIKKVQLEAAYEMEKKRLVRPVLSIRDFGSNLEVNMITGLIMGFALSDFINILQEGADIMSATCHHAGDRAIYTILSQAIYPRIGIATSSVHERLKTLIY